MASSPRPEEFQIGWICALPIEAAAAIQMLDESFGILQEQDRADTNTYTLGRIGNHHVAIACLPDGQHGTADAATVANNMMRTFSQSLRIGLMVGIGGGIPSSDSEHDIRLGDIVISRPEGSSGGVIQHDMGKIVDGGRIKRTGSLNSPPKSLLAALSQMRAAALYDDPKYPSYVQQAIGKNARTKTNFGRPEIDRLFKIEHEHVKGTHTCEECLAEWEEPRSGRTESEPQAHYGVIASGNTVIKDGATREKIRKETGALCFEMEAAGLMADFPCIVIRGISDYSDSHKNKQWQGYAALTAAAYAKELLSYVPRGTVSQERLAADICSQLDDIREKLDKAYVQREDYHREQVTRQQIEDQRRCHQVFKTSTYEQHKNNNPDRAEGTCQWVLQNAQYLRWWESSCNDILWISADPGCGKSVLAKSLIDDVFHNSTSNVSVCYFFFKENAEQNQLATALCALLHQLFGMQPELLKHAIRSWEKNHDKIQEEVDELWRIFMAAASDSGFTDTICVLDALDECRRGDQDILLRKLDMLFKKAGTDSDLSPQKSWLKFVVTSRPYDEIKEGFRSLINYSPQIHLRGEEQNDIINHEISNVVKLKVAELSNSLGLSPSTKARLEKQFLDMNNRTYLWLHLAIEDIRGLLNDSFSPDQEVIPLIPRSVNDAYQRILNRVKHEQRATVRKILQIIVAARRPLTIREMAAALEIANPNARTVMQVVINRHEFGEKMRRLCGLFVFINDRKLYLIHQTAREFLITTSNNTTVVDFHWKFTPDEMEVEMTRICVKYLLMLETQGNTCSWYFVDYSAENWPDHYRQISSTSKSEVLGIVQSLYGITEYTYTRWLGDLGWFGIYWRSQLDGGISAMMTAMHLVAFLGHDDIVRRLAEANQSAVNQRVDSQVGASEWACLQGWYDVDALQWACLQGHKEVVEILLEYGANPHAAFGDYGNALWAACDGGNIQIVQLLLDQGVDVNAESDVFGSALQAACEKRHFQIVQLLLENGADVHARCGRHGNALQAACKGGDIQIVLELLERGVDVNAQGGIAGNAFMAACNMGDLQIIHLLLDNGAEITAPGNPCSRRNHRKHDSDGLELQRFRIDAGVARSPG